MLEEFKIIGKNMLTVAFRMLIIVIPIYLFNIGDTSELTQLLTQKVSEATVFELVIVITLFIWMFGEK